MAVNYSELINLIRGEYFESSLNLIIFTKIITINVSESCANTYFQHGGQLIV